MRAEFLAAPLVPPAGQPAGSARVRCCGLPARRETRLHGDAFDARLCGAHRQRWVKDGRPAGKDVARGAASTDGSAADRALRGGGVRPVGAGRRAVRRAQGAVAAGRAAGARALCCSARTVASGDERCRVPDWGFRRGARPGGTVRHALEAVRRVAGRRADLVGADRVGRALPRDVRLRTGTRAGASAWLPDAPLLALELRFVLQCRHDEGERVHPPVALAARWSRD